jgi:hypothetical protein
VVCERHKEHPFSNGAASLAPSELLKGTARGHQPGHWYVTFRFFVYILPIPDWFSKYHIKSKALVDKQ